MSAFQDISDGMRDAIGIAAAAPVLDQATVRALCDAGYMTSRDYIDLAKANGWAPSAYLRERETHLEPPYPAEGGGDDLADGLRFFVQSHHAA